MLPPASQDATAGQGHLYWPLAGLRLRSGDLELRLPREAELTALAADGVHDPAWQPFSVEWTDASPLERARSVLQYHWSRLGAWRPDDWELNLAVFRAGGQGFGTRMRAAVLGLAFDGLGAQFAVSGAFTDARPRDKVRIEGLQPCLPMFGLS